MLYAYIYNMSLTVYIEEKEKFVGDALAGFLQSSKNEIKKEFYKH